MSINISTNSLQFVVEPSHKLHGQIRVPGDKSISHRSIMFGALAQGTTEVIGFLPGADCLATLEAFRAMGVTIQQPDVEHVIIEGVGLDGLQVPTADIDLGNSGTAMRLLTGIMAAQQFDSVLTGDASLNSRPMRRITAPLADMGSRIEATATGTAPLHIKGGQALRAINYRMPVASAQVKSCLLLAGLYAKGTTTITEPAPTRDHTERMLQSFSYKVDRKDATVCLNGGGNLHAGPIQVPSDISSAAFFWWLLVLLRRRS